MSVDLDDLQGNVLAGYDLPIARYLGLRVVDAGAARAWLGAVLGSVTTAALWPVAPEGRWVKPRWTLNVAVSAHGLAALGVPTATLATLPVELRAGMAARAALLGDRGADAPAAWTSAWDDRRVDLLVTVCAADAAALEEGVAVVDLSMARRRRQPPGLEVAAAQETAVLGGVREHFGFRDGASQPAIDDPVAGPAVGDAGPRGRGFGPLAPGEFVLGYADEEGQLPRAPRGPLGRSGSYLVLRRLEQDVAALHAWLDQVAGADEGERERVAAGVVGRWPDGSPLVLTPDAPSPALARDRSRVNAFTYGGDAGGRRCPLGAHVRRANPRDALGDPAFTRRHRIIRRGMPYGPVPKDPRVADGVQRGLMFVCLQASIQRQFELIQARWLADGDPFELGEDADFLLGPADPGGRMVLQGDPPRFLGPKPGLTRLTGGGYFLVPGLAGLRALAAGTA